MKFYILNVLVLNSFLKSRFNFGSKARLRSMKELVVSVASRRAAIVVDGRLDDLFIESQTRLETSIAGE